MFARDAAGAFVHVIKIGGVFGVDAVHAPDEDRNGEAVRTSWVSASTGTPGRLRAALNVVEPVDVNVTTAAAPRVSATCRAAALKASTWKVKAGGLAGLAAILAGLGGWVVRLGRGDRRPSGKALAQWLAVDAPPAE